MNDNPSPPVTPGHSVPAGPGPLAEVDSSILELADRIDSLLEPYLPNGGEAAPHKLGEDVPRAALADELRTTRVVFIDDRPEETTLAQQALERAGCQHFVSAPRRPEAIEIVRREQPDVILLSTIDTNDDGFTLLLQLMADPKCKTVPTIVVTSAEDREVKQRALAAGANDFLVRPLDMHELIARVRNAAIIKRHLTAAASQTQQLEQMVQRRTVELEQTRQELILSLARAAEHRDNDTGNHVIRVGCFAAVIADQLGWSPERCQMLEQAAQLHDVGKIGVPDEILFKPGKLEADEFDIIKKHCAWGKDIIEPFTDRELRRLRTHTRLGESILHVRSSPMLMMASRIAQTHHENWDGTGYPLGLSGEDIPIEGRITAVADVYDALSSKRPYKPPFSREKCFAIMEEQRGKKFDPSLLDLFLNRADDIIRIQLEMMDEEDVWQK